jgi:hypothetical protein
MQQQTVVVGSIPGAEIGPEEAMDHTSLAVLQQVIPYMKLHTLIHVCMCMYFPFFFCLEKEPWRLCTTHHLLCCGR